MNLYVEVDVSKGYADSRAVDADGKTLLDIQLDDVRSGSC